MPINHDHTDEMSAPSLNAPRERKQNPYRALADRIAAGEAGDRYIYCMQDDRFFVFKDGVYESRMPLDVMGTLEEKMPDLQKYDITIREKVIKNLKVIVRKKLEDFNSNGHLNLENCLFDPLSNKAQAHTPDIYSTIRLSYKYDSNAVCPLWLKTMGEIFEGHQQKIDILQEFFGYCLTKDTSQKKALLLLGESNCGKSTLLYVLHHMLGEDNCANVPLKHLGNPQYIPMLVNKLVNFDTDISRKADDFEMEFRMITSGEKITCNQKYVETFGFIPTCKLVMAGNAFPRIHDTSSAFYNRLVLIPCNRIFLEHEQNKGLNKELLKELPGILNWSVKGLLRLKERKMFAEVDFMKEAVEELREENNPIEVFFKEHIEVAHDEEIEKGYLYEKYKTWCDISKIYPLSTARFAACVYKKYISYTPKDTSNSQTRKRVWRNLRYLEIKGAEYKEVINWDDK